jgi:hypothetical protein
MLRKIRPSFLIGCLAFSLSLSLSLATAAAPSRSAIDPVAPGAPLRQQAIHIFYNEGDFDKVVAEIDAFTAANKTYSRADSVFIAKHLAVVYSANPNTREKGKYFMYRLLEIVPSAELVDMFVSDEIDRIFDKVRKEFLARQKSFGVDSSQISIPEKPAGKSEPAVAAVQPAPSAPSAEGGESGAAPAPAGKPFYRKKGFWMITGAGVAAVGAVVAFVHLEGEEAEGKTISLDPQ